MSPDWRSWDVVPSSFPASSWQIQPSPGMEQHLEEAGKAGGGTRSQDLQPGDVVSQCPQLCHTIWRMSDKAHSLCVKAYMVMVTISRVIRCQKLFEWAISQWSRLVLILLTNSLTFYTHNVLQTQTMCIYYWDKQHGYMLLSMLLIKSHDVFVQLSLDQSNMTTASLYSYTDLSPMSLRIWAGVTKR